MGKVSTMVDSASVRVLHGMHPDEQFMPQNASNWTDHGFDGRVQSLELAPKLCCLLVYVHFFLAALSMRSCRKELLIMMSYAHVGQPPLYAISNPLEWGEGTANRSTPSTRTHFVAVRVFQLDHSPYGANQI